MTGGDVEELLGGSWALMSQLMDQGLAGGPRQESSYDVGQLVALLEEAPDVPTKSFPELLSTVFKIPWFPKTRVYALEVFHKDLF